MKVQVSLTKANILADRVRNLMDDVRADLNAKSTLSLNGLDLTNKQELTLKCKDVGDLLDKHNQLLDCYERIRDQIEHSNIQYDISALMAQDRTKQALFRFLSAVKRDISRNHSYTKVDDLQNVLTATEIANQIEDPKDRLQALNEIRANVHLVSKVQLAEIDARLQQLDKESIILRDRIAEINRKTQIELNIPDNIADGLYLNVE